MFSSNPGPLVNLHRTSRLIRKEFISLFFTTPRKYPFRTQSLHHDNAITVFFATDTFQSILLIRDSEIVLVLLTDPNLAENAKPQIHTDVRQFFVSHVFKISRAGADAGVRYLRKAMAKHPQLGGGSFDPVGVALCSALQKAAVVWSTRKWPAIQPVKITIDVRSFSEIESYVPYGMGRDVLRMVSWDRVPHIGYETGHGERMMLPGEYIHYRV